MVLKAVELAFQVANQILPALAAVENFAPHTVLFGGRPDTGWRTQSTF